MGCDMGSFVAEYGARITGDPDFAFNLGRRNIPGSIVLMAPDQMATLSEHLRTDTRESYVDNVSPRSGFGG